jgi:dCTP diphosphatase
MSDVKQEAECSRQLNLTELNREFRAIAAINNWQAYHTPKNLAAAITVEASELLAEFQWLSSDESSQLNPSQKDRVASEVADVIMYLSELCEQLEIDMAVAVANKIEINRQRFKK